MTLEAGSTARRDVLILILVAVTLVAAATRIGMVLTSPVTPLVFDMAEYWDRAVYLFEHGRLYPDSWRMPGLPIALAAVFTLTGEPSIAAARLLNVVAGTSAVVLTYLLARRVASAAAAAVAALAVALYPSLLA